MSLIDFSINQNDTDFYTNTPIYLIKPLTVAPSPVIVTTPQPLERSEPSPYSAFNGIISECLYYLSYSCFQKKLLVFVDRLDKKRNINIYGTNILYFIIF